MDRYGIFARDFFTCQRCGSAPGIKGLQIAHRIKQGVGTEKYIKQYTDRMGYNFTKTYIVKKIINHPYNLVTTCSLKCNDSFNIFNKTVEMNILIDKILKQLDIE